MAIIPILYSRGIQVCALPTALLSSNTCYEDYVMQDTTDLMQSMPLHWVKLGLEFDAIYSGFLGSPVQANIVNDLISKYRTESTLIIVDPVLADDGKLYSCYDEQMVDAMKTPLHRADIITPNFTEACLLTNTVYRLDPDEPCIRDICTKLAEQGPRHIVITSIPGSDPRQTHIAYYNTITQYFQLYPCDYMPCFYPGTGDVFTTVLLADVLNGIPLELAIPNARDFVFNAIKLSLDVDSPHQEGLCLDIVLNQSGGFYVR